VRSKEKVCEWGAMSGLKIYMVKIKLGWGFNVLPQSEYFMFMDVFCKGKKFQLFNIAPSLPPPTIQPKCGWRIHIYNLG
jgi:hypothetical protein